MILTDPLARPVIAHRGASGSFPENTVLAFREALAAGADAVELDVRLTSDGVPVVIHDATVDRTTDGVGAVRDQSLHTLREWDAGGGERIPTLVEVLRALGQAPAIVEIKERHAGRAVLAAIHEAAASERVLVGAYDGAALRSVRRAGLATAASRAETTRFWVGSRVGLSLSGAAFVAFSVPEYRGRIRVVDERFVRLARRSAKPVHVWTVDEAETARRLRGYGVAGILTNFPERLAGLA